MRQRILRHARLGRALLLLLLLPFLVGAQSVSSTVKAATQAPGFNSTFQWVVEPSEVLGDVTMQVGYIDETDTLIVDACPGPDPDEFYVQEFDPNKNGYPENTGSWSATPPSLTGQAEYIARVFKVYCRGSDGVRYWTPLAPDCLAFYTATPDDWCTPAETMAWQRPWPPTKAATRSIEVDLSNQIVVPIEPMIFPTLERSYPLSQQLCYDTQTNIGAGYSEAQWLAQCGSWVPGITADDEFNIVSTNTPALTADTWCVRIRRQDAVGNISQLSTDGAGVDGSHCVVVPGVTGPSYPLGHQIHTFETAAGDVQAQGWDDAYYASDQADKDAMTNLVSTYLVGLRDKNGTPIQVADIASNVLGPTTTGCPSGGTVIGDVSQINTLPDVGPAMGNPQGPGVPVYLVYNCNFNASNFEINADNIYIAVHGSAAGRFAIRDAVTDSAFYIVDSFAGTGPRLTSQRLLNQREEMYFMYSEAVGAKLIAQPTEQMHIYKSHLHGVYEFSGIDSTMDHYTNGVIPTEGYYTINSNIEGLYKEGAGAFRVSDTGGSFPCAPLSAGCRDAVLADSLVSGGFRAFTVIDNSTAGQSLNTVYGIDNEVLGLAGGTHSSTSIPARCEAIDGYVGGSGWTLSDGVTTSGTDPFAGAWDLSDCNAGSVPAPITNQIANDYTTFETWVTAIRQAAAAAP